MGTRTTNIREESVQAEGGERRPAQGNDSSRAAPPRTVSVHSRDNDADTDKTPEQIRAEIERTRANMSQTIDELQERLAPERLKNEVQEAVRAATIGRVEQMTHEANRKVRGVTANVVETVRENPAPAAMIGLGLGWLAMRAWNQPSPRDRYGYQQPYAQSHYTRTGYTPESYGERRYQEGEWAQGRYSEERGRVSEIAGEARQRAGDMVREAREGVEEFGHEARERVEEFTHQAREQVDDLTHQAREQMEEFGHEVQMRASRAGDEFQRMVHENPLGVAAAGLALGLIVGLAIPETRKEQELMGPMRDDLLERAQEATQETMNKVQRVAEETQRTAVEETEEQFAQTTGTLER